jgi:DNA replication and repair protein RecF
MIVAGIALRNFRNHAETTLEFGNGINALLGRNGEGKTNVLEAVSFLSLTKSFYAGSDASAVRFGSAGFELGGGIVTASGTEHRIRVAYPGPAGEKIYQVNGARPETLASVIGRFPVVVLSPENGSITSGGPAERRRFMDLLLSQESGAYLEELLEYRRALKQRNRLLLDARLRGGGDPGPALEPWDEALVTHGSALVERRRAFVGEFGDYVLRAYAECTGGVAETPAIRYATLVDAGETGSAPAAIREGFRERFRMRRGEELRRGTTLVGPHRDELEFTLNGTSVQQYASQGQHKTFLVALKVAEFHFLRDRRGERPLLLLDDVFSELDAGRASRIVEMAASLGQTIITTTDERSFGAGVRWGGEQRRFLVREGTCAPL